MFKSGTEAVKFLRKAVLVSSALGVLMGIGTVARPARADGPSGSNGNDSPFVLQGYSEGPVYAFPENHGIQYRLSVTPGGLNLQKVYGIDCWPKPNPDGTVNCVSRHDDYWVNLVVLAQQGSMQLP